MRCTATNKRLHLAEQFLQLPPDEQASILQTLAGKLGRRAEHLEKDVWICWVLQALFTMPDRLPMALRAVHHFQKSLVRSDVFPRMSMSPSITNPSTIASTLSLPRHRVLQKANTATCSELNSQTTRKMSFGHISRNL